MQCSGTNSSAHARPLTSQVGQASARPFTFPAICLIRRFWLAQKEAEVFEEIATMDFPFEGIPTIPPGKDMKVTSLPLAVTHIRCEAARMSICLQLYE